MGQVKEYLTFNEQPSKGKTKIWEVIAMASCICLGVIKWKCSWRKYSFRPYPNTEYEQDCWDTIGAFLRKETTKQRTTWKRPPKEK